MMTRTLAGLALGVGLLMVAACDREPEDPSGYGNQPSGYDQYGNPIYGTPGQPTTGYPQPGYPQPGQPPPAATTTAPPSPLALPCQNDFTCGTHKCNLQTGRCAFPCANAQTDCAAGMGCVSGLCVPGAPQ